MDLEVRILAGIVCSAAVALFALTRGSLSRSGAVAAVLIGTAIFGGGGALWFCALLAFFATSTLLGKVGRERKARIKLEFEKGDTRDAWQAFSNGGVAALAALGMLAAPSPLWQGAFIGALATANGDTWATELGVLSRKQPWSLRGLRRVPRGTSGAISGLGVAATAGGGLLIGAVVALGSPHPFALCGLGLATGVLGSLIDSVLGASAQAAYLCPNCHTKTEGAFHHCGSRTQRIRGFSWCDNDLVNMLATLGGAILGALSAALAR